MLRVAPIKDVKTMLMAFDIVKQAMPDVKLNIMGNCRALLEGEKEDPYGRAGVIVPLMNSQALVEAIIRCLKDPENLRRMGIEGRKRVEAFYSKAGMMRAFGEIYKRLGGA